MKGSAVLADVVIGPQSEFSDWIFDTIAQISSHSPERPLYWTDRLDVVEFLTNPRPICLTSYPSRSLIDAIDVGDARVVLIIEDPVDVTLFLKRARGMETIEAIRAQTASAVANLAIGRAEQVHYLYRTTERRVKEIVVDIARHLSLPLAEHTKVDILSAVSRGLGPEATVEEVLAVASDHHAPPLRSLVGVSLDPLVLTASDVVNPLLAMARGDMTRPIVWPTQVFTCRDFPSLPTPQTVEIGGPVRDLYDGPHLYLPPGRYRVETILAFSDEIKDVPFVLEVHGATWLVRAKINQHRAGEYRGYFIFDHTDPSASVEIRLRNERGVTNGRLSLVEILFFNLVVDR